VSQIARLSGALLAHTQGHYYLIGNLKRPCDFAAEGFEPPAQEIDPLARPFIPLSATRAVELSEPLLELPLEGPELLTLLARRLLIERNGSVSDRLWRLILGDSDETPVDAGVHPAPWFATMPERVWSCVRESVLRCL
jgi:hypothetical protein